MMRWVCYEGEEALMRLLTSRKMPLWVQLVTTDIKPRQSDKTSYLPATV